MIISEIRQEVCWVSEHGNQQLKCVLIDNRLFECTWPNQFVERFRVNGYTLIGVTNPEILGYIKDGVIAWNTGNTWVREGNR